MVGGKGKMQLVPNGRQRTTQVYAHNSVRRLKSAWNGLTARAAPNPPDREALHARPGSGTALMLRKSQASNGLRPFAPEMIPQITSKTALTPTYS